MNFPTDKSVWLSTGDDGSGNSTPPYAVRCKRVRCTRVRCTLYDVHCTMYTVRCTRVRCTRVRCTSVFVTYDGRTRSL